MSLLRTRGSFPIKVYPPFIEKKKRKKKKHKQKNTQKKKQFTLVKTGLTTSLSFDLFLITDTPNFEE